jgi:hypothetical protein
MAKPGAYWKASFRGLSLVFVILLVATGCSLTQQQKRGIEAFATSTIQLGQIAATNFQAARAKTIEVNSMHLALRPPQKRALDGGMTVEQTIKRVAVAEALQHYGELLLKLGTSRDSKEIERTVTGFKQALTRAGAKISTQQYDAIGEVTTGIGKWFLEWRRLRALRSATEATTTEALAGAELIARSFANEKAEWVDPLTLALDALENQMGRVQDSIELGKGGPEANLLPEARVLLQQTKDWRASMVSFTHASAEAVSDAQKNLEHLLKYSNFDVAEINAFAARIQNLVAATKLMNGH